MIDESKLSPTQRLALARLRSMPGRPASRLPGGERTVRALMRRWLVEIVEEDDEWRVYLATHEHRFTTTMHMDACHWFASSGACMCGATMHTRGERGIKADPYSAMWFADDCERCDALAAGARPTYDVMIVRGRPVLVTVDEPETVHR